MKEHTVRISFDVPEDEHVLLKTGCAEMRIAIKDYLHELLRKGLRELQDEKLKENLKLSIKQAKEGKVQSRGSFANYVEDEI
jgi:hypothetical protein